MANDGVRSKRLGRPAKNGQARNIAKELKDVALDLFAERGYGQVTIKDIASAADVNTAMIYYYFSDKESLCRATTEDAVERVFTEFKTAISKVSEPREKIKIWLITHIELVDTLRKMVKVSLDLKSENSEAYLHNNPIDMFYDLERETLSELLNVGIERGEFREVNVDEVRRVVSTFLDGAMIRTLSRPKFDLESTVSRFLQVLMVYLTTPPSEQYSTDKVL